MPSTDRISVPTTTFRWSSNSRADRFAVENPATGEVIAIVQGGDAHEVDQAVQAANQAFERDWRWRTSKERERILLQCADVLEAHADELAELESCENGKPIVDARLLDVNFLIQVFRFFGNLIDRLPSEFYRHYREVLYRIEYIHAFRL
jgi:acyl-CoA reductase-like NAD-dependent aldehyde dehydrogenase